MKKRTLLATLTLVVIAFGTAPAFAANPGHDKQHAMEMREDRPQPLSPEKQAAFEAKVKEHMDRVEPLRDKLDAKMLELTALSRNPNTTPATLSQLAGEVSDLRVQLRKEGRTFAESMEKEFGISCPGMGMGRGMGMHGGMRGHGMGHGMGMAPGMGMGGMGMGPGMGMMGGMGDCGGSY